MTEQILLALKAAFVVVLYLFVWRVIRLSVRDLKGPQESMVLGAREAAAAGLGTAAPRSEAADPRLVVLSSPVYPPGTLVRLRRDVTFGFSRRVRLSLCLTSRITWGSWYTPPLANAW